MSSIIQLTDAASHAAITSRAESQGKPTVIYVSNSSLPACKVFTPAYEKLSSQYDNITFAQMDFSSETSMLFKFAPNQLPVLTLMCRESEEKGRAMWAKTIMGAEMRELVAGIDEMLVKAGLR